MNYLHLFVFGNGIYDILCSLAILEVFSDSSLALFHNQMYQHPFNDITKRYLSYFLMTIGLARLKYQRLASFTYYVEAFCYFNELYSGEKVNNYQMGFFCYFSVLIGLLLDIQN
jgi:hypothetical protein|tara:strand:- start:772 stop:1113 length:342 start_codon:yes stop_codon:yes gene_type:complete